MGGRQIPEQGPNDDGYDEEGYDESQRAEILEVTRDGPSDGTLLTDIAPDLGDGEDEDELSMTADEVGEEDEDAETDADDQDEDEVQADFDADALGEDDDLDDADEDALSP